MKTGRLLKAIRDTKPESIKSLAAATGRKPGNLCRTLKTMSHYGLVEMKREKILSAPPASAHSPKASATARWNTGSSGSMPVHCSKICIAN
ncbi:HVO_A0114 family putative DNA-binding protein [Methylococcus mesophilus]